MEGSIEESVVLVISPLVSLMRDEEVKKSVEKGKFLPRMISSLPSDFSSPLV